MAISTKELSKKDLGQYFTPAAVVDFALDMARAIVGPRLGKTARLLDPACGAGAFLLAALDKDIGSPASVFGTDIDPAVKTEWELNGLSIVLGRNLYLQNGLYDPEDGRISEKFSGKQFDLVIGNPPYGGIGVQGVEEDKRLLNALKTYELWRPEAVGNNDGQRNLFGVDILDRIRRLTSKEVERLERFPIEVLFLERFVRLAKTGGVVAIVIPDGILANIKFNYVRNWLAERCSVIAIISLPRGTFKGTGTTAKTSLLFLKKDGKRVAPGKKVFMAQLDDGPDGGPPTPEDLAYVLRKFKEKTADYARNSPVMWKIMSGELWDNRWDPEFWDPTFREPIEKMKKKHKTVLLKDLILEAVSGYRGKTEFVNKGIRVLEVRCIRELGIDFKEGRFVKKGSAFDKPQYYVKKGDVLIVRSGVASAGRIVSVMTVQEETVICGDIFKIILDERCEPGYFTVLMQSKIGTLQLERVKAGIASTKIDVVDIRDFVIPLISKKRQKKAVGCEVICRVLS